MQGLGQKPDRFHVRRWKIDQHDPALTVGIASGHGQEPLRRPVDAVDKRNGADYGFEKLDEAAADDPAGTPAQHQ